MTRDAIKIILVLALTLPSFAQTAQLKPIDLLKLKLEQISAGVSAGFTGVTTPPRWSTA